jgi:NAD(P)-dependent dehydrogenase (short-subunit alcohol dehydrogenase family)
MSQRVLITAAASGIGLEIARAFSAAGATVFITDINTQAIDAAEKEIPGLLTALCDNSKRSDIKAMVPTAVKALGGLDVPVNACDSTSQKVSGRKYHHHVLSGRTFRVPQSQSVQRRQSRPDRLCKTLALELGGFNIRANAIAPGAVGGERIKRVLEGRAKAEGKTLEQEEEGAMSIQALKRFVDPKDIAALCVFLTSDAGKSITGQVLPIGNGSIRAS